MDEDHLTPWAASGSRNYSFQFTCDNHQQLDVFQGSTSNILPYSQEDETNVSSVMWRNERKNISIIYFEDEQDKQRYCRWAETIGETAYEPDLKFSNEALYGIGKPAGKPLKKWIGKKNYELWEFDDFGMYKRAGCHLRAIGRWLGAAVYVVHCAGQYVGDLLNSTFVDDKAQRVSFIRRDTLNYQNMNVVDGIQQDLEQLVDFVNAALKTCPTTPNPKTDVNMFLDLYQEILNQGNGTLPTTLNDLQLMSYFLCHTPLYWDTEQRLSFCNTYWSLRQSDEWLFDYYMPYTGSTFIADSWCHNLSNLPPPFLLVYNNSNLSIDYFKKSWYFDETPFNTISQKLYGAR